MLTNLMRLFIASNTLLCGQALSIKLMPKQHVLFFPARFQQPLPSEMYNKFVSKMKDKYEVHIATNNVEDNTNLINSIQAQCTNFEHVGLIAHSSGVHDLLNLYSEVKDKTNVRKIVLIEPLDFQILPAKNDQTLNMDMINFWKDIDPNKLNRQIEEIFETNYLKLARDNILGTFDRINSSNHPEVDFNDPTEVPDITEMLLLKHAQSEKWRFIPTIPPLAFLAYDINKIKNKMNVKQQIIQNFTHFDILDKPWANIMNRATLIDNRYERPNDVYLDILDDVIVDFYE